MALLLDLIGSALIGGILVLQLLNMSLFIQNAGFSSDNELKMQQNAKTLAEIINYDFRKIGYQFDSTAILTAEQKKIKFIGDLERQKYTKLNEDKFQELGKVIYQNAQTRIYKINN